LKLLANRNKHTVFIGDGADTVALPPQGRVEVETAPRVLPQGVVDITPAAPAPRARNNKAPGGE